MTITKQQLRQLRWLKSEIKLLREQIENMEFALVTDMVKGSHREHPYTKRSFKLIGIDVEEYRRKTAKLQKRQWEQVAASGL